MKALSILISALFFLSPSLADPLPDVRGTGKKPFGPFTNHCFNYKLNKGYNMRGKDFWLMIAECDVAGAAKLLSINLDDCIANLGGRMAWQSQGMFTDTCQDCEYDMSINTILTCNCEGKGDDGAGGGVSSLDLVSYADVTRKHSEQTPEEAAAPAVPEIIPTEPPSDSVNISPAPSSPPKRARLRRPSDPESGGGFFGYGAPSAANVGLLVAVGAVLGFKAWGLYERGVLGWKEIGIGAGIMGGVGAVEAAVGRCLQQKKD